MENHKIVSRKEWLSARRALLAEEKELTRKRDEVSAHRRELPWVLVDKLYTFDTAGGPKTLGDLFEGRTQLLAYHFMFDPSWEQGCKSCSFWADTYNGIGAHLNQRDVTLVAISRAPLDKLLRFRERMGWSFEWVSSFHNDFNHNFHVSFTEEEIASGQIHYNFDVTKPFGSEAPGISVFCRDDQGAIYHTYSCYARGLDMMNAAYQHLDLVPKGRDEQSLSYPMAWVRLHDRYGS